MCDNLSLTLPDPLLMNAFNTINLAGACILTSTDHARELGIPSDRWIYALGGAGTRDSNDCELVSLRWICGAINNVSTAKSGSAPNTGGVQLSPDQSTPDLKCQGLRRKILTSTTSTRKPISMAKINCSVADVTEMLPGRPQTSMRAPQDSKLEWSEANNAAWRPYFIWRSWQQLLYACKMIPAR